MDSAIALPGIWVPEKPRLIVPSSPWIPALGIESLFEHMGSRDRKWVGDLLLKPVRERVVAMAGSLANYSSKKLQDIIWGATAYTAVATNYFNLWAATLDDTFNGATASKCAYVSYAALALTNNTTIFAAGSGTTTYTKTFPSDAVKSWATSTGTGTNNTVTYLGIVDGNLGTSADNGIAWCSITSTTINLGDTPQLAQNAMTVVQD